MPRSTAMPMGTLSPTDFQAEWKAWKPEGGTPLSRCFKATLNHFGILYAASILGINPKGSATQKLQQYIRTGNH